MVHFSAAMAKGQQLTAESLHANIQVGIYMAFNWTADEIAAQMGLSVSAINARKQNKRHRGMIDTVKEYAALGVARLTSERILKAEEDFRERKNRIHSKGYKVVEKVLDDGLKEETTNLTAIHLRAAEQGIERNEGRPLDRKAILNRYENAEQTQIDDADLHAILGEQDRINRLRDSSLLLTAGTVKDAEIVQPAR